ncbi:hypothetical protein ACQP00_09985 [Dactylosporangium sp. CS-047395]|uniref:hypothetical protein n=1 Tax=Dactylosporangium sp. CS-047395 TaxID=3239936 RepID=UPI003D8D60C8
MARLTGGGGSPDPIRFLQIQLAKLRIYAGNPTYDVMAARTGVSRTNIYRLFKKPALPNLNELRYVVEFLAKDVAAVLDFGSDPQEVHRYFMVLFVNCVNDHFPDDPGDAQALGPADAPWPLGPNNGGGACPLPGSADESRDGGALDACPSEGAGSSDGPRSQVLIVGVTRYLGGAIVAALTALARLLGDPQRGRYAGSVDLLIDPTREQLWMAVLTAARRAEDNLIVYFVGHGFAAADRSYLAFADSSCDDGIVDNVLRLDDLRFVLAAARARRRALMLDWHRDHHGDLADVTAPGESFGQAAWGLPYRSTDSGAYLLSAEGDQPGAFTQALVEIMRQGLSGSGRYETLASLQDGLVRYAADRDWPAPRFAATGRGEAIALSRLVPAAEDELFIGRHAVVDAVLTWLDRPASPALVVTGAWGSGKTALLAALCRSVDGTERRWPAAFGRVDGFVDAHRSTGWEVIEALRAVCRVERGGIGSVTALEAAMAERSRPLVVVVDGLDEASLLARVLGELAGAGRESRLRLVIGTRRRDAGEFMPGVEQLELDGPIFAEPDAVRQYCEARLRQAGAARPDVEARAIAKVVGGSFRWANLLVNPNLQGNQIRGAAATRDRLWAPLEWLRLVRVLAAGTPALLGLTADEQGNVLVRDAVTGDVVGGTGAPQGSVSAASVMVVDDRVLLVTAGEDRTTRLWNPSTGTSVAQVPAGDLSAVSISVVGDRIVLVAGGADGVVRLWDPTTGTSLAEAPVRHAGAVTAVAMAEIDGHVVVASGGADGAVRLWDAPAGEDVEVLRSGSTAPVSALRVSILPTGHHVVLAGDRAGHVRWWSESGVRPPALTAGPVHDLAVEGDGRIVVVTREGLRLLRMPDGA